MPVGLLLQALFKSLSGPFAAFRHHFALDLAQGAGTRWFCIHPLPLVGWFLPVG